MKLDNGVISVEIANCGAELKSAIKDGFEYMWCADGKYWARTSPVLFPFVGSLKNKAYKLDGKVYPMCQHGFARDNEFEIIGSTDNSATFVFKATEETLKKYPFDFELLLTFELCGKSLVNTMTVINKTDGDMYFSIGAHPGFNCNIGDVIEFEYPETLATERIDSESILIPERFPVLENSREIEITEDVFKKDALILSGMKSEKLRIKGENEIEFTFGKCPVLGIWAKPGAPYVCIEPWYGINDDRDVKDDISKKREIQHLNKGETFEYAWKAEIIK